MLGGGRHSCVFYGVISLENLFTAWEEFRKGKKNKSDVLIFSLNLEDNIFTLSNKLHENAWKADPYTDFSISDPKPRHIHKASVGDRVLYHAVHRVLYPIFDSNFIFDSYSSRLGKGTHAGVQRLEIFVRKLSRNYTRNVCILKCDIKKFFDSIDHKVLMKLLGDSILDKNILDLLYKIITSFHKENGKGLPLGNITSQLFANVYLNPFDWFVKKELKIKHYIRYCDDFVILSRNKGELINLIPELRRFLVDRLKLELHPVKVEIRTLKQGIDFLGYIVLPHYRILRTKTKKRLFKKLRFLGNKLREKKETKEYFDQVLASYLGILQHCKGYLIEREVKKISEEFTGPKKNL